jgi:hypothetical protein
MQNSSKTYLITILFIGLLFFQQKNSRYKESEINQWQGSNVEN